jgi:hypothetical protein
MIDRQHGKILIECDACDATFQGDTDDWREEWAVAKAEGWKTRKIGEEWMHFCAGCRP